MPVRHNATTPETVFTIVDPRAHELFEDFLPMWRETFFAKKSNSGTERRGQLIFKRYTTGLGKASLTLRVLVLGRTPYDLSRHNLDAPVALSASAGSVPVLDRRIQVLPTGEMYDALSQRGERERPPLAITSAYELERCMHGINGIITHAIQAHT